MIYSVRRDSSCDTHRVNYPMDYLRLPKTDQPLKAQIYFFNRIPNHDLEYLKKRGLKIVCDIDDYWELNPEHYLYHHFKAKGMAERIINSLHMADVVLTTHGNLADKVKEHNKNVYVVPNAIPYEQGQFNIGPQPWTGKVGFVGGMSHYKDVELVKGMTVPNQVPISEYMNHYKGLNICVAPLIQNEFNEHKSNLKVLEAACGHALAVCSDLHPFRNLLDEPYVEYCQPEDWTKKLKYLQANPNYAQEKAERLAEHCRAQYDLKKVNSLRKEIFLELLRKG